MTDPHAATSALAATHLAARHLAATHLDTGHAYERALFGGRMDELREYLADDVTYWVAGAPPIGGLWRGRDAVVEAFANREAGLGAADWAYEELKREWTAPDEHRVVVEIHERSWLKSHPADVMDQHTFSVLRFHDGSIAAIEDYADALIYEQFVERHRAELPKFRNA
jgi:ketosteroid isomerase-like protein